jgi:hypothetical protein
MVSLCLWNPGKRPALPKTGEQREHQVIWSLGNEPQVLASVNPINEKYLLIFKQYGKKNEQAS